MSFALSPPDHPTVSAIICVYTEQRWNDILLAAGSLTQQTAPPAEIILVVDHNQALYKRLHDHFPDFRVVENHHPRGLSGARNSGVDVARGTVLFFLDDDAQLEPTHLEYLLSHHRFAHVLGVGGGLEPAWEAAPPRWFPDEFLWVVGCRYQGLPTKSQEVRNVFGCCMSIRQDVFGRVGGFNVDVGRVGTKPLGGEETDLCIRAALADPAGVFIYEPRARGSHRVPRVRARWRYFCSRCFHEGLSKSLITRRVGARRGLGTESAYASRVLPRAVLRGLSEGLWKRDPYGPVRALNITAGLVITGAGYAAGHLQYLRMARRLPARPRLGHSR